jgi:hypothetical protein
MRSGFDIQDIVLAYVCQCDTIAITYHIVVCYGQLTSSKGVGD